jgi:hypothetical protein
VSRWRLTGQTLPFLYGRDFFRPNPERRRISFQSLAQTHAFAGFPLFHSHPSPIPVCELDASDLEGGADSVDRAGLCGELSRRGF